MYPGGKTVTFFPTFVCAADMAPGLAPEPGIVFYMLWAKYLATLRHPAAPADDFADLTSRQHPRHTTSWSPGGARNLESPNNTLFAL